MPFLSKMLSLWRNFFRRRQVECDLDDELQTYVEEMAERKIQAGIAPETAREAVLMELGGIDRIKVLVRQQRIGFGDPRKAGMIAAVAIVAFASGAGVAVGAMRWRTPVPERTSTVLSSKDAFIPLPVAMKIQKHIVLEGRVVDKISGQPIPHVEVGLVPAPDMRRYTFTDSQGRFSFFGPPETPYRLEAGNQRWSVSEIGFGHHIGWEPSPPRDFFEFLAPSSLAVKDKNGQPQEGEPVNFQVTTFSGKPFPPPGKGFRRFRYEASVLELRTENLQPGNPGERLK